MSCQVVARPVWHSSQSSSLSNIDFWALGTSFQSKMASTNRPRSIYQYSSMAPRLSGQNCKFFKFLLSSNPRKRLRYKENNTKYRSLTRKPRNHVRILIYRTWPIEQCTNHQITSHSSLPALMVHHYIFSDAYWFKLITWHDRTLSPYIVPVGGNTRIDSNRPWNFFCKQGDSYKINNWNCIKGALSVFFS